MSMTSGETKFNHFFRVDGYYVGVIPICSSVSLFTMKKAKFKLIDASGINEFTRKSIIFYISDH